GSHRTRTGIVMGTPAYMSPEQCEGKDTVDHRTDVYALGIVLYEMLTGRVPFVGEGYGEILVQHLTQPPTPVSRFRMLPAHVEVVVMKALEKRADLRYPNMDEFMRAMSDPVGYVEAHGGVAGFAKRQLMPSTAPLPAKLTPAPLTPAPGSLISAHLPSQLTMPAPTTMSSAAGSRMGMGPSTMPGQRSRMGTYIAAGAGVVVAAVIAIVIVATGKDKLPAATDPGVASGSAGSALTAGDGSAKPTTEQAGSAAAVPEDAAVAVAVDASVDAAVVPTIAEDPHPGSNTEPGNQTGSQTAVKDETVEIRISSSPNGARIFVDNEDTGKLTPSTLSLPRSKTRKVNVALKLKSYSYVSMKVDASQSSEQRWELTRLTKQGTTPSNPTSGTRNGSSSTTTRPSNQDPDGLMRP
ncbi:MAG TPA: PEGA domain-containing protein, partial [Kofleriaceae bacterium]